MELLTEKVISRVGVPVSPGDGLRLILEAISAGILLPNSVGLLDPCEKEQVDALRNMTPQQRNDVTAFGQVSNYYFTGCGFWKVTPWVTNSLPLFMD